MLAFANLKINDIDISEENEFTNGVIRIYWSTDDIGHGIIDIIIRNPEGEIVINDSRNLGRGFIEKVMETLVRQARIIL